MKRTLRYRLSVASRVLAAAAGGYVATSLFTVLSSRLLLTAGVPLSEAILAPTITSFLLYAGIILAVFSVRSAARAWFGVVILSLLSGAVLALLAVSGAGSV